MLIEHRKQAQDIIQAGLERAEFVHVQVDDDRGHSSHETPILHEDSGAVAVISANPEVVCRVISGALNVNRSVILLRDSSQVELISHRTTTLVHEDANVEAVRLGSAEPAPGLVWMFTSGTTGTPKAVPHTLARLLGRIRVTDQAALWLLTYHPATFAGLQVVMTAVASGQTLISSGSRSTAHLASLARTYQPTHISGTPTFWRAFIASLGDSADELPLQRATLGGEVADQATLDLVANTFTGARISHIYASTEGGALFTVTDSRSGFPSSWLREGIEGVALRIREDQLEIRSPRSADKDSMKTGSAWTEDGWLRTGDLVEQRDSRVVFTGRSDSVINVGGSKVRPETVESVLLAHPLVREIRVYGAENPITGNLVAAEVVPVSPDVGGALPQQLRQWASDRLARHEIPRTIEVVATIATGATGKKRRS